MAEGLEIFTPRELEDKAREWLINHDADAKLTEWFLVRDGLKLYMVMLYKKDAVKGVYCHQHLLSAF